MRKRVFAGLGLVALLALLPAAAPPAPKKADGTPAPPAMDRATVVATPSRAGGVPAVAPDEAAPGARELSRLEFLSGKWKGSLDSYPIKLDISIVGAVETPGREMTFRIHAVQPDDAGPVRLPIDGDYSSTVTWSGAKKAVRAVLVDTEGRGVEMLGQPVAQSADWLFNSTPEGSPFPFSVRVTPVNKDRVVLAYKTGGRLPLTYEITFDRVPS